MTNIDNVINRLQNHIDVGLEFGSAETVMRDAIPALADAWDEGVRYATGSMDADVRDNPYRKK